MGSLQPAPDSCCRPGPFWLESKWAGRGVLNGSGWQRRPFCTSLRLWPPLQSQPRYIWDIAGPFDSCAVLSDTEWMDEFPFSKRSKGRKKEPRTRSSSQIHSFFPLVVLVISRTRRISMYVLRIEPSTSTCATPGWVVCQWTGMEQRKVLDSNPASPTPAMIFWFWPTRIQVLRNVW